MVGAMKIFDVKKFGEDMQASLERLRERDRTRLRAPVTTIPPQDPPAGMELSSMSLMYTIAPKINPKVVSLYSQSNVTVP